MKTLFIEAKRNLSISEDKINEISSKLPNNIAIAYSIQYKDLANNIRQVLSREHKHKITAFNQILGCSNPKFSKDTKAILLISNGKFHAISLAFESKLPVYLFDNGNLEKILESDIRKLELKEKASYMKYLHANNIGILISNKPGQENLKRALTLKNKLKNKKAYLFLTNTINISEFQNFPQIESWVNTACPRMNFDYPIINICKLEKN